MLRNKGRALWISLGTNKLNGHCLLNNEDDKRDRECHLPFFQEKTFNEKQIEVENFVLVNTTIRSNFELSFNFRNLL